MKRQAVLERAARHYDAGAFLADLARLVAVPSESQEARGAPYVASYLTEHLRPVLETMGFLCQVLVNPASGGPLLLAERIEDPGLPTVLVYGHGDVISGLAGAWQEGLSPWRLTERGGRIYGRGVADNKGQHAVNLAALGARRARPARLQCQGPDRDQRGNRLAGSARAVRESSGAAGRRPPARLRRTASCARPADHRPRQPGRLNFDLAVDLRESGHHSGNWGGLLANPAIILAHAIAIITSKTGAILLPELKPRAVSPTVTRALAELPGNCRG